MDFINDFLSAMQGHGFTPKDGKVHADDKWHDAYYAGEKGAKSTGRYTLKIVDGDFAIGCYFTFKDSDNKHDWHSNSGKKLTQAERDLIKRQIEAEKKLRLERENKKQARLSGLLNAYFNGGIPFKKLKRALDDHPYLQRKGIKAHGLKLRAKGNELIMPCYQPDGNVWTMQRILPNGKKFLIGGGKKKGSYFPFVKAGEDMSVILVCEGFSTGASIREATGLPVAAAIDAGNLKPVLRNLKKKFPNSRFIICADNDEFTRNAKKELWNVGIEKAKVAAVDIGGASVVWPTFNDNTEEKKLSDFNDLHKEQGLQAVADVIMPIVRNNPVAQTAGEPAAEDGQHHASSDQHLGGSEIPPPEYEPDERDYYGGFEPAVIKQGDFGMNFKCLGYDAGMYFYFSYSERRIVALSAQAHSLQNLLALDTLEAWKNSDFGGAEKNEKKIALYAFNAMRERCTKRGVFRQGENIRGGGAWLDKGRVIVNSGDRLFVNGEQVAFDELDTDKTYVASERFMRPSREPCDGSEAHKLRTICELVTWDNPLSGALLAGWLVIAPVCGALDYRPHIWIEGEAESGKSTVMNKIIRRVLGRMALSADGATEAALRETTGHDARPIVYDEAEPSPIMEGVIELTRKASYGGIVRRFGQGMCWIRYAACFASINPPVNKTADETRISFLKLRKNKKPTAIADYDRLLKMIEETLTPEFSNKLLARTIQNLQTLFENIQTFQSATRRVIKGARASEQIGTMIAGLYLLHSTKKVSDEEAQAWIERYKWNDHTAIDSVSDPVKMVQHLSGALIKYVIKSGTYERTVGELIVEAQKDGRGSEADRALRPYGIMVKDNRVFIASTGQNLARLFSGTDWQKRWGAGLQRVEGALEHKSEYFAPAIRTNATSIPVDLFVDT